MFGRNRAISTVLPELAPDYQALSLDWEISWWDGSSVRQRLVDADDSVVELPVGRAALAVVVARPVVDIGVRIPLAPYGGWATPRGDSVALTRHCGELGEILLGLAQRGLDPALVNVERLLALILRECASTTTRYLDTTRISAALFAREMRASDVCCRDGEVWELRRQCALPELWLSDDPAAIPVTSVRAGEVSVAALPVISGEVQRYWTIDEAENSIALLTLATDHDGRVTALLTNHVVD